MDEPSGCAEGKVRVTKPCIYLPAVLHYYRDIKTYSVNVFLCIVCANSFTDNVFITVSDSIISSVCKRTILLLTLIKCE